MLLLIDRRLPLLFDSQVVKAEEEVNFMEPAMSKRVVGMS